VKEIATRFDFRVVPRWKWSSRKKTKSSSCGQKVTFQVDQVRAMLENHMIKRKLDPQCLDVQKMEASGKEMHQDHQAA
jgi:uncharacterized protein YajQ (UPF0234 family)